MLDESINVPATTALIVLHNVVTETVGSEFIKADRRNYYCPVDVLQYLKKGIFAGDEDVRRWSLPDVEPVEGLPGLALEDVLVNC